MTNFISLLSCLFVFGGDEKRSPEILTRDSDRLSITCGITVQSADAGLPSHVNPSFDITAKPRISLTDAEVERLLKEAIDGRKAIVVDEDSVEQKPLLEGEELVEEEKFNGEALEYLEGLLCEVSSSQPFSGWIKWMHDSDHASSLQQFKDGKLFGLWMSWHGNGKKWKAGSYKDGEKDGLWISWHEDGQRNREATFKNGKPNGPVVYWHRNGQKHREFTLKGGKPDGQVTAWHDNGQTQYKQHYRGGVIHGPYVGWHANGQRKREVTFKEGKLDGPFTAWYANGQKEREAIWKDGKPDGLMLEWHQNGQKASEGTSNDGKPEGLFTKWHSNGQKAVERNFKDGEQVSAKYWNSEGEVVETFEETRK